MTHLLAALLAVVMLPIGLFMLCVGVGGFVYAFTDSPTVDFADYLFEAALFTLIGLLMTGFAGRWVWLAIRETRRDDPSP